MEKEINNSIPLPSPPLIALSAVPAQAPDAGEKEDRQRLVDGKATASCGYGALPDAPPPEKRGRVGNSTRCCCCLLSPGASASLVVTLLLLGVLALFIYYLAYLKVWLWAPAAGLALVTLWAMFVGVGSDPGIIPRGGTGPPPPRNSGVVLWQGRCLLEHDKIVSTRDSDFHVVRRWCSTCKVLRPPRASHCKVCDNCVDVYDHHCGVIGACVGRRTLRYFVLFLWGTTLLSVWVGSWSILYFASPSGWKTITGLAVHEVNKYILLGVGIFACTIAWLVGTLAIMYLRLIAMNLTQRESDKREFLYQGGTNPFDVGCVQNCLDLLCRDKGPSLLFKPLPTSDPWSDEYAIVRQPASPGSDITSLA